MQNKILVFCAIFLVIIGEANSLKLLLVSPIPVQSHYFIGNELGKGLARLGHNVTIIATYNEENPPPNYTTIYLDGLAESAKIKREKSNMFYRGTSTLGTFFFLAGPPLDFLREHMFTNHKIQKLIQSGEKFDAVIVEQFWNDAMKVFAHIFDAHLIIFSTVGPNRWVNNLVANPENPSYISDIMPAYSGEMNLFERLHNLIFGILHDLILYQYFYPKQNALIHKYFPTAPHLNEILPNASLVLTNSHESIFEAVPHVPNMIDIGGFHVNPSKKLPKDIQEFMDNATEGVIYFSMGSNLVPTQMPKEKKDIILKALGARKEKVLWKWNEEQLDNQPSNLKISKWFPQQGILAHPNCKLFISHGGLLSTIEAIHLGVPILVLPVYGDQGLNSAMIKSKGIGISISFTSLTQNAFDEALNTLLRDNKYAEAAKQNSQLLHDRPMKPIEVADYWIKYVVRHNGAKHLRVAGISLPLYKYYMLDVFGVFVGVIAGGFWLFCKLLRLVFRRRNVTKTQKSKKDN